MFKSKFKIAKYKAKRLAITNVFKKMSDSLAKLTTELFNEINDKNKEIETLSLEVKQLDMEMQEVKQQKEKIDKLL